MVRTRKKAALAVVLVVVLVQVARFLRHRSLWEDSSASSRYPAIIYRPPRPPARVSQQYSQLSTWLFGRGQPKKCSQVQIPPQWWEAQEDFAPPFVSIPDLRPIHAGETVCIRVVVPAREHRASLWYMPLPNMPWDSVLLDLVGLNTSVSVPVNLQMVQDFRNTNRSSVHVYEADVTLRDADSYVPRGVVEFRDAQWNPQSGLRPVEYDPEPLFISPQLQVTVDDPNRKYTLDNYLELPLCTEPDAEGRWIRQADLPFNQTLVPAAENHGLVWLPYDCRLRPISYQEFGLCTQTRYPRMHWFGDSNIRRSMKKIVTLGEWCTDPERLETRQCLCEDYSEPFDPFDPRRRDTVIDLDRTAGGQAIAVPEDFTVIPPNKTRIYMHKMEGLYTVSGKKHWLTMLQEQRVAKRFGHPMAMVMSLTAWDSAFLPREYFSQQMDRMLDYMDQEYSNFTEIYVRTGQYFCCRTDSSKKTRSYSRLRNSYYSRYVVDAFRFQGSSLLFYVNGVRTTLETPDLDMTLLEYLRSTGLTGTKLGCGEGGCGACTVMVSRYSLERERAEHTAVNACLCPLYTIDGAHVVTVEGLGTAKNPHAVQQRLALLHASQCGFCTPGFVMSLYVLLRNKPDPTEHEIEECFDGNLCRCTGYRPILDAAKTFSEAAWKHGAVNQDGSITAKKPAPGGCGKTGCCQEKQGEFSLPEPASAARPAPGGCCKKAGGGGGGGCCKETNGAEVEKAEIIAQFKPYNASQEPIFPPFLVRYAKGTTKPDEPQRRALAVRSQDPEAWCKQFYRPLTLAGLQRVMAEYPDAKLVAGNSEVGVEIKFKRSQFPVQVYVGDIAELRGVRVDGDVVEIGANTPLAQMEHALVAVEAELGQPRTQSLAAMRANLKYFAGNQIRNVATLAGNIATASPISDLNPVLMAAGAVLVLAAPDGSERLVAMDSFFLGYRRTAMQAGEILRAVRVPLNRPGEIVRAFKQAKRQDDDIAIVTCGLRVVVDAATQLVTEAAFAFGGMGPTTALAQATAAAAVGCKWGERQALDSVLAACADELRVAYTAPGGMAEYRSTLATSFIFKFWTGEASDSGERELVRGRQEYATVTERAVVGHGVTHRAALQQTTGEARYLDDMPAVAGELALAMVPSQHAHARLVSIDATVALEQPGVRRVLTSADVPGANVWNIFHDEEILPSDEVHYHGQPVALVLADTPRQARAAALLVQVEYEPLPAVLGVREAVEKESWFPEVRRLVNGDVDAELKGAAHVISGESYCGAQEHFYLETMASITVPRGEDDEYDIYASSQNPTEVQSVAAEVLGIPASRVVAHVKRMGGGFGGKESRSVLISAFTTLGAYHTNRSVRLVLDRDEDMRTSGQRHPFFCRWTVGADASGRLLALRARVFSNGGFSHDLSMGVLERAVSHIDNCYRIAATDIVGRVCRTNTQSNTAFRSFGGAQGMLMLESALCELADRMGLPVEQIRQLNMYRTGDVTPFSQELTAPDWNVPRMWNQLRSVFDERRQAVDAFNAQSRYRKRGVALVPTKFGISFGVRHLNQGMALVHIYTDGSVLVAHGGTEMGQGLHTKMAQVAAETLGLPLSAVFISETATNTAANTSPTAASASSDLNGFAVYNACRVLADRLQPYRESMPNEPFAKVAKTAYLDRCQLSQVGHYATPDIGFNWETNTGLLYFYFTQGVALAEVELDILTGSHSTRAVRVLMDVGKSLNKAIDIGQIEGAFAQGMGWSTCEEFLYSPASGRLFTQGPGNYKIPSASDIPRDFQIELLEDGAGAGLKTIFSSKGIGEPPLFLGASVFFALRDAVLAARSHTPHCGPLHLESPATPESLRLACEDHMTELARIPQAQKDGQLPFALRI
ncbi:hypothetical protein GGF46_004094 [Coemansia sp. RSA 552]|nr:hypothetical protein GGF46_004094 [Coemansia sp. RSA 552]